MDGLAANRVALGLLEDHRRRLAAVDREIQDRSGACQRVAQLAGVCVEADRLLVAAVEDPGHAAFAAQAPCSARALGCCGC